MSMLSNKPEVFHKPNPTQRSNADIELRRYREADVVKQQRLLASLESRMEQRGTEPTQTYSG
eukprot:3936142-Amphidinium_carterae.1